KDKEFILTRATGLIRLANKKLVLPEFTKMFLNSPIGKYSSEKLIDGSTGQIVIKTSLLKEIKFPLPPLTEQKRIVEKVDKLMAYCDELKKQVKENQENSEKLMSAVLKESFE
ncbi:MAG: restriction endonuclease subunit S, partial [archaeon]|nr:restriction endonuclease subunit S [archaeon]